MFELQAIVPRPSSSRKPSQTATSSEGGQVPASSLPATQESPEQLFGRLDTPLPLLVQVPAETAAHSASLEQATLLFPEHTAQGQSSEAKGDEQAIPELSVVVPVVSVRVMRIPVPLILLPTRGMQS